MKQRIMNNVGVLVALGIFLSFLAASGIMYDKYNSYMQQDVKNEAEYIRYGLENTGIEYLTQETGQLTTSRITLLNAEGKILYDSERHPKELENHGNRPEIQEAMEKGEGEQVRFSETLSDQTFYYAVKLDNGDILRVAKTTDSVFHTMVSSFTLMGVLFLIILALGFLLIERQTKKLIEPINRLDLEQPLKNVEYEELRPLLNRVDEQNKQIASQVEELKQAEAVRREFSANVSHELKTPLMSISGYAEIMKNGMVRPQDISEFAGRIYDEASRLTSLVQDIIEISKLDEKSGEMPFENVDIYEIAQDICQNLTLQSKKKNVTLSIEGSNVEIYGVRHILYEMCYNLVDNAMKYNREGGYVKVSLSTTEDHVCFTVEDNGIGIAKEEQERIFERFYRVDKSHSRKTGGTGLGLSIVKHGAALHHAQIVLNSEPEKGTKIQVFFKKS
ncbi:sensor histidine kinase [Blautia sp. Marseille-P3201T]|uniref:sensor histidine kinase n=1 Tax=Blautia sp. Marseille-P3201T TaxID=1907659 RepID=UPI000931D431|nr:ATP-binding protein [Blautia sp. Marseille-P3201T]